MIALGKTPKLHYQAQYELVQMFSSVAGPKNDLRSDPEHLIKKSVLGDHTLNPLAAVCL